MRHLDDASAKAVSSELNDCWRSEVLRVLLTRPPREVDGCALKTSLDRVQPTSARAWINLHERWRS